MKVSVVLILLACLQDPVSLRVSGKEKYLKGDLAGAEVDLNRAIDLDPKDAQAYLDRGDVEAALGRWDRAISDYTRTLDLEPDRWFAHYARGVARISKGELAGAIEDLNLAIGQAPRESLPYQYRAIAKWRSGDNPGAIEDFELELSINPKSAAAYGGRGLVRDGMGDAPGALEDLSQAVRLGSRDPQVYVTRGRILFFQKGSYGQGMEDLDQAVLRAPRSPFGHLFRGFALIELDQEEEAIEDFTRAVEILPDAPEAYQGRGVARRNRGDRAGAVLDFTRAIALGDADGSSTRFRGYARFDLGDWKGALEDLEKSAELGPGFRDYSAWRSWICRASLGDREGADRLLKEYLVARKPRLSGDWAGRIGAYLDRSIPDHELLSRAASDPERCEALFYIGWFKLLGGDRDGAADAFGACSRTRSFDSLEFAAARAALERLRPGAHRPPLLPGRLKIEILHVPAACPRAERGEVCPNADHWRTWIDEALVVERERMFERIREEAEREPGEVPGRSRRRVLVWAEGKAPYERVSEVVTACLRAGMGVTSRIGYGSDRAAEEVRTVPAVTMPSREHRQDEEDLEISLAWDQGRILTKVGEGLWLADEREVEEAVKAAGATQERPVRLVPAQDVPVGEAIRWLGRLRAWSLRESDFMPAAFRDPGPRSWEAVRPEEAQALGRRLEEAVAAGTPEAIDRALARQEILRRVIGPTALSGPAQRLVDALLDELGFTSRRFPKTSSRLRPLKFLRVNTVDGAPRPLLRILDRDRFDYVELELGKGRDGEIYILDVRSFEEGGLQSLYLRRACMPRSEDLDRFNRLRAPTPEDLGASYKEFEKLNELIRDRKFAEALAWFDGHRLEFHADPAAHRSHLRAARQVGPQSYLKAIEDLEQDVPEDSLLLLLRVDGWFMAGEYEKALGAVDALEKAVGDDPFLLVYRANLELVSGHAKKAQELAEKAASREPTLDRAWWALLNSSAKDRDNAAAVRALNRLEKNLKIQVPDLRTAAGYEDLIQSQEFMEWIESQR